MSNSDTKAIDILNKDSLVTKEELALYLYNLVKDKDLDSFIRHLSFVSINSTGVYTMSKKRIIINYGLLSGIYDDILETNLKLIEAINHETFHAVQIKLLNSKLYRILPSYFYYLAEEKKLGEEIYYKEHDNFLEEYQSYICSTIKSIDFLTIIGQQSLLDDYNNMFKNLVHNHYSKGCPIESAKYLIEKYKDEKHNVPISLEEYNSLKTDLLRLEYGYPISDQGYYEIENSENITDLIKVLKRG